MRGRHHQFFDIVIVQCLHALDSSAASVLAAEVVYGHTFNITKFGHCDNCIFSRDHILHGDVICIKSNGSSSVIAIFLSNCKDLLTDDTEKRISVCKNCL